jgi:hypothetical protein
MLEQQPHRRRPWHREAVTRRAIQRREEHGVGRPV